MKTFYAKARRENGFWVAQVRNAESTWMTTTQARSDSGLKFMIEDVIMQNEPGIRLRDIEIEMED